MIKNLILFIWFIWLVNRFFINKPKSSKKDEIGKNGNSETFLFGTSPWKKDNNSKPINENYDKGPNW